MEQNNNNSNLPAPIFTGWTEREIELLSYAEKHGVRPISPSLAGQVFALFLEGYTCSQIAKQVTTLSEAEILHCRHKFNWDAEKDRYMSNLTVQVREKLQRQKMESIEFLTNMMSVTHRQHRDKMLKYLQTGDKGDLPEFQITSIKSYKEIIETIGKITGEDKVQKHIFDGEMRHSATPASNSGNPQEKEAKPALTQELQSKILRALSGGVKAGTSE